MIRTLINKLTELNRITKQFIMGFVDSVLTVSVLLGSFSIRLGYWYWPEGDQKTGTKEKTKVTLKRIAIHSQFLLSGIIKLAECYTKEDHVLVTMGLKPGTIAAAEAATGAIGASVAKQPTTTEATAAASSGSAASTGTGSGGTECTDTASSGCTGTATTGPDSYTKGVEKLKDF